MNSACCCCDRFVSGRETSGPSWTKSGRRNTQGHNRPRSYSDQLRREVSGGCIARPLQAAACPLPRRGKESLKTAADPRRLTDRGPAFHLEKEYKLQMCRHRRGESIGALGFLHQPPCFKIKYTLLTCVYLCTVYIFYALCPTFPHIRQIITL